MLYNRSNLQINYSIMASVSRHESDIEQENYASDASASPQQKVKLGPLRARSIGKRAMLTPVQEEGTMERPPLISPTSFTETPTFLTLTTAYFDLRVTNQLAFVVLVGLLVVFNLSLVGNVVFYLTK